jgi:hypothetical protein
MRESLCESCVHLKVVKSASGARFLMCQLAKTNANYSKYVPQPVVRCPGHEDRPA